MKVDVHLQHRQPARLILVLAVVSVIWSLFGCARPQLAGVAPMDWTSADSGAYIGDHQERMFLGIGRASGMRSTTLLRATADNQAQSEMADVVKAYLSSLGVAVGIDASQPENRQMLYDLSRAVLRQARIVDHRYSDRSGIVMALCRLDLDTLKQVLAAHADADQALKKQMLIQTDKIHAEMIGRPF